MTTKAEELFKAKQALVIAEERDLWNFLSAIFGESSIDNYEFDDYDESLELLNVNNSWAPNQEQLTATKAYGFKKLYLIYEDTTIRLYGNLPSDEWQRYGQ